MMCHPTQMLADALTVQENFNYDIKGLKFVFFGDLKNNMGRSLMVMCAKLGMNFVGCGPKDCSMDEELIKTCEQIAAENGCTVKCTEDVKEAATRRRRHLHRRVGVHGRARRGVGAAHRAAQALPRDHRDHGHGRSPRPYSCTACRPSTTPTPPLARTSPSASASPRWKWRTTVFESKQSKVFDEAENRMHTIKAVMYATLQ